MTTKLCDFCGKEIPINSKICPYCNKALTGKAFSYTAPEKKDISAENSGLDISKYLNNDNSENKEDYFSTNIYSFSQSEIERRFERKNSLYDEEEREYRNEAYRMQHEEPVKSRKQQRKKKNNMLPVIVAVLAVLIVIIIAVAFFSGGNDTDDKAEATTASTTQAKATEPETTEQTTTMTTEIQSTTQTPFFDESRSVDLCGYLLESFSSFEADFGAQTKDPAPDEFYGGYTYYYDGMSVSTDENGTICAMNIDYAAMSDKTAYYFKDNETNQNITFFSNYNEVISILGEPDNDQMNDPTEPCITYQIYEGSSQSIKIRFDADKKVSGFDLFLSD